MDARSAAAHVNRVVTDVTAPCTLNAHRSDPSCGVNTAPTQTSELRTSWRSARQLENYPFRIVWRSFSGAVVAGFLRDRDRRHTPVGRPQDALKASRRNGGDGGSKATKHNGACNSSAFDAVCTSVPEHARCYVHARARARRRACGALASRGEAGACAARSPGNEATRRLAVGRSGHTSSRRGAVLLLRRRTARR